MKNLLEIREATESDVPIILKFIKQFVAQGKLTHQLVATEEIMRDTLFGSKVYAEVILGCINQEPVSYALFSYHFSTLFGRPSLYLVDLYVMPEFRHQGIAHRILSYLAKLAKENKCCRLEWMVLEGNDPAVKLYKKIGAKELSDWRTYRMSEEVLDNLAKNVID